MRVFYRNMPLAWKAIILASAAVAAIECSKPGPTNLGIGQGCQESTQCSSGICLSRTRESKDGKCSRPCGKPADCPAGWTCTALTQDGVLVCQEGSPTPFGL